MEEPLPERGLIFRAAIGIGLYAMAFGASFGAISVGSGLTVGQTMVLSLVMFTGASQFAFVGVAASGGSPFAAVPAALLLGVRNAFYGVPVSEILHPRGFARLWTAHFVIDETTAMAISQATPQAKRYAFWATGLILFSLWQLGSLAGGLVGRAVNPADIGLWPMLRRTEARWVALGGALLALALVPIAPPGVPVVASAIVALVGGLLPTRQVVEQIDDKDAT
jgi:predicted branched-subunit amino acid permease